MTALPLSSIHQSTLLTGLYINANVVLVLIRMYIHAAIRIYYSIYV